jgi:uncharacterized protein with von Willebrand factor type A (vWA) domain
MTTMEDLRELNYPETWLQDPEQFAKRFVSYGAVKAAFYDVYDEENYEIWVSPQIETAATYYDSEKDKHLIFVGNSLQGMTNISTKKDMLSLVSSLIIHECGHILYTERDLEKLKEKLEEYDIPFALLNLAEDARIEYLVMRRVSEETGRPFHLNFKRWLPNAKEHAMMSPESILFNILNEEGRRVPAALHAEEVFDFYKRFIKAKSTMEVVEILREWVDRWHPKSSLDQDRETDMTQNAGQGQKGQGQKGQEQKGQGQKGEGQKGEGEQPSVSTQCGRPSLQQSLGELQAEIGENMRTEDMSEGQGEDGEIPLEELKANGVPVAGAPATGVEQSAPFRVENKGELQHLEDHSNTSKIFSGEPGPFDHKEALDILNILRRISDMKKRKKVSVRKPTKRLNARNVSIYATTVANTRPYKKPIELPSKLKKKNLLFVLDLSASMSGTPVRAQRALLIGANRLAKELPGLTVTVIGSKISRGYEYETVRLPSNEENLLAIRADGGGEGIAYALNANADLAREQDIVIFITDGNVSADEVSKEKIRKNLGAKTVTFGAYVGPDRIPNREMKEWFDHLVTGEKTSEVFKGIVDLLLDPRKTRTRRATPLVEEESPDHTPGIKM